MLQHFYPDQLTKLVPSMLEPDRRLPEVKGAALAVGMNIGQIQACLKKIDAFVSAASGGTAADTAACLPWGKRFDAVSGVEYSRK